MLAAEAFQAENRLLTLLSRPSLGLQVQKTVHSTHDVQVITPQGEAHTFTLKHLQHSTPGRVKDWLKRNWTGSRPNHTLVLSFPWVSEHTLDLLESHGVSALDLAGNHRLRFGTYLLERTGHPAPKHAPGDTSLFTPKASRILRAFFADPQHPWGTQELADRCQVSLGQVSKIRQKLISEGHLVDGPQGLRLSDPQALLSSWVESGLNVKSQPLSAYTPLHGKRLEDALRTLSPHATEVLLSHENAAGWMSPFLTPTRTHLYASTDGWHHLQKVLQAETADKGGNLTVHLTDDPGVFLDRVEVAENLWTTSPVQTYLDLHQQGNRGKEAAQKLLDLHLLPLWQGTFPYRSWPLRGERYA
ncbi:type IV toxin-antitoxin system AbiEi family antitoxin [Deinococcus roseus]|uniref:MarR family transcriptional regulator n=1 Tax=Deinococcus roseus TaxID=392414 RepID=A0ABQ2DFZ1_9DEIO|nr:type IV toxin-antitoxin system AbiEi family antitoxin [Deinococcus roseus]GGJ55884.1 hypothetical protein GCM10008938_47560 [Deinococcus roseus]